MMLSRFPITPALLACFLFVSLGATPIFAASKAPPPAPPDMRKLIKSVDVPNTAVVIVYMHSKLTHTYHVDDVTALKVNGVAGKFADIKPGMVVADYTERDDQSLDALTLTGWGEDLKPAAKPASKPKPTPKPKSAPAASSDSAPPS